MFSSDWFLPVIMSILYMYSSSDWGGMSTNSRIFDNDQPLLPEDDPSRGDHQYTVGLGPHAPSKGQ
jgi:hypothetical protein